MQLTEKKIILVYTFIGTHSVRQSCDLSCYGRNSWILDKPSYVSNNKQQPELKGFFKDYYKDNEWTRFLFKSAIFTYFNRRSKSTFSDENLELTAALLDKIRFEYEKNHNVLEFYNLFNKFSSDDVTHRLTSKLLIKKIKPIVNNQGYIAARFQNNDTMPSDGHPTALGQRIMVQSILWRLRTDHPELFN